MRRSRSVLIQPVVGPRDDRADQAAATATTDDRDSRRLRILAGPTGVGKSAVAVDLARLYNGAIISADSMQVYQGFAIGTAQPSLIDQATVPHRLVGHVDPTEFYDAARFVEDAEEALADFRRIGRLPFLVGGTGMYLKSLIEGLFEGPSRDDAARARLQAETDEHGPEALHERLRQVDHEAAERIHPRDAIRIIRALEVFEVTGQPISWWHEQSQRNGPRYETDYVILTRDREDLTARIDLRVNTMIESGWVDEVRGLLRKGVPETAPAFRALGYQEILAYVRGGRKGPPPAAEIAHLSRQYAKRQMTWFRAVRGAKWINLSKVAYQDAIREIARLWRLGALFDAPHAQPGSTPEP